MNLVDLMHAGPQNWTTPPPLRELVFRGDGNPMNPTLRLGVPVRSTRAWRLLGSIAKLRISYDFGGLLKGSLGPAVDTGLDTSRFENKRIKPAGRFARPLLSCV